MLFDLRGRGRRRTVRAIYLGLALLIGVGLVGFGIGGGAFSGGLLNSLSSGGSSTGVSSFSSEIKSAQKVTREHPNNANAWANLTRVLFQQAGIASNYDDTTATFNSSATPVLQQTAAAWQHYLLLDPNTSDWSLADQMLSVYEGTGALSQPAPAAQALQIVIAHEGGSAGLYSELAVYSYQSKNEREGDLAAAKAIALTPKASRSQLEEEFAEVKGTAAGTTPATVTAPAATATATVGASTSTSTATAAVSTVSASTSTPYSTTTTSTASASTKTKKP